MSINQTDQQQNQERLAAYSQQFKAPVQAILANMNQIIPNAIDQLSQQCVMLTVQVEKLQAENDTLKKELEESKKPSKSGNNK